MNVVDDDAVALRCINHPARETYLRCGKCGDPICPRCMITTPVGARCRECAQLRKLPQYEIGWRILVSATLCGLVASAIGWYLLAFIPVLRVFASAFLGMAVGEVVSRMAKRRSNTILIGLAITDIVLGWIFSESIASQGDIGWIFSARGNLSAVYVALPLLLASYFAYARMK